MSKIHKKGYLGLIVIFVIVIAAIGGAFYLGYQRGTENPKTVLIEGVSSINVGNEEAVDFSLFWEAWQLLKKKYVNNKDLDNQNLLYGAISGIFYSVEDDYTVFMPPSDAQKFVEDISGEFSGIGAEIGLRENQLVIVSPLKGTPADRAGLRPMDKILEVNSESTDGITVDEAVKKIRGAKGTTVVLTILRDDWSEAREVPIVRDTIQVPTLDWEIKDNGIAYIHLYNFYERAPYMFYQMAIDFAQNSPKGIVLDLRNNPGGYLDVAINLAGWFVDNGDVVVTEEFGTGNVQNYTSYGNGYLKDLPIIVLMNEGSASASEILAGALRDIRGAEIVGQKSFGKGTVQEVEQLSDGSLAKITVAHWRLPDGQLIEKNGLDPDYEVELTEEDFLSERDPQLDKAMELMKQQIEASKKSFLEPLFKIEILPI